MLDACLSLSEHPDEPREHRYALSMTELQENSNVGRIAAVLRALGSNEDRSEMPGSEVARIVGRERSQISRMLKALEATGLVERNPETRAYRLGWQLYALTARAGDQRLLDRGAAILRAVAAETGESALLSVLQGNQSFTVLRERSRHTVQAGGWVGRASPLHLSASGRALLFDYDDDSLRDVIRFDLEDPLPGQHALSSLAEVVERVHQERQIGAAVAIDELEIGLASIGVPVRDGTDRIIASLNVSGPTSRMRDRIDFHIATAKIAARRLSREMTAPSTRHLLS